MLHYDYNPQKSPHAHHGAACSENRMIQGFKFFGQACSASSLTSILQANFGNSGVQKHTNNRTTAIIYWYDK